MLHSSPKNKHNISQRPPLFNLMQNSWERKKFSTFHQNLWSLNFLEYIRAAVPFGWSCVWKEPRSGSDPKSALPAVAKVPASWSDTNQDLSRQRWNVFLPGGKIGFLTKVLFPRSSRVSHCLGLESQAAPAQSHDMKYWQSCTACLPTLTYH